MADLLATPPDLASLLQRDLNTMDPASLTLVLEISTGFVQAAAEQRLVEVVNDQVTVYGDSDRLLRLPERPVMAVTSVTYQGSALTQGTASGTWRLAHHGIWRDCGWPATDWCAPSPVDVVYSHGYPDGHQKLQPARGSTLSLARTPFINPDGTVREQIDDYAVAYEAVAAAFEASPAMRATLRRIYGERARFVKI